MAQSLSDIAVGQLSLAERLDRISELWDSIPDSLEELPMPEWHREELERRLAAADADPEAAIPLDIKQRCEGKRVAIARACC